MATNAYLKEWEPYSAITKLQGDLLGDIQRLIEAESNLPQVPSVPTTKPKKVRPSDEIPQEQFADKLAEREKELEILLETLEECKKHIDSLKEHHEDLTVRTNDFQSKCGSILKEQKTLHDISEELSKSLEYYKEVDAVSRNIYKKQAAALLSDANFSKMLTTLEEAEVFFTQNADYLDSKEYLLKISNSKRRISEIIQDYIQKIASDQYIQTLPPEGVTPSTLSIYKTCLYTSIELFDLIKPAFIFFQEFAAQKAIQEYLETVEAIANAIFTIRKGLVTEVCDYLIDDALKAENLSQIVQKLLQIQAQLGQEEQMFFKMYFVEIERVGRDISGHFETVMYNYLRPLIIQESNVKELSSAIVFTKKVFFDQSALSFEGKREDIAVIDKKFLTKVMHDMQERLLYLLDNYINEKLKRQVSIPEEIKASLDSSGKDVNDPSFGIAGILLGDAIELLQMCDECLDREIVASVSIEIIHPCIIHLENYKGFIENSWKREAFMVKNFFYLLDKLRSFNIELISQEEGLDFSYTKESIIGLIYGPKKLKEYNWLGFIGDTLPKLQQSQRDLKKDLIKRFDEHLVMLTSTCVSLVIPQVIKYLTLCDTEDPERLESLRKIIRGTEQTESSLKELFKTEIIKSNMQEMQKALHENLISVAKLINENFAGEIYGKLRAELLTTVAQEITNNVQKWYDKLAVLLNTEEYESLGLPNIKAVYEAVSHILINAVALGKA